VSLLLAFPLWAQEPPQKRRVRFPDGRAELCEVVSRDAEGVTLRLDGLPRPVKFRWSELDPEDAQSLRGREEGRRLERPGELTVPGLRVRTLGDQVVEGIVLPGSPSNELWLKNAQGRVALPLETIASREEVPLELRQVYAGGELLDVLTGRLKPTSPQDYDRLGAELLRARLRERAMAAFKTAELLRHPDWPEARIYSEMVKLRDRIDDIALQKSVFEAQERYLAGDYESALAQIEPIRASLVEQGRLPDLVAELDRLRTQILELRGYARDEQIVQEGYRVIEALLKARALDPSPAWADSKAYVQERMMDEVLDLIRARFNFSPEDAAAKRAWDRRPAETVLKHDCGEASWWFLRPDRCAPEAWWAAASGTARYRLLKGLFIEKNLIGIRKDEKSCGVCGGLGQDEAGTRCAFCQGLKILRVLLYR
jgi:hypothetical protein